MPFYFIHFRLFYSIFISGQYGKSLLDIGQRGTYNKNERRELFGKTLYGARSSGLFRT